MTEVPAPNSPDSCFEQLWLTHAGLIGRGTTRNVYALRDLDDIVLKVSTTPSNFTNWAEIVAYHFNQEGNELAKVTSWSWSGKFLVMERLAQLNVGDLSNYQFPSYITDRKLENFGRDKDGLIKALDYASLKFPQPSSSVFA